MADRLARYVDETTAEGWRRAASEQKLRLALGRAVVSGTVDRVEVDPSGRVRVVDLKTGSSKPTRDEVRRHGQLGAYQLAIAEGAFAEHGTGSGGAALLQLGKAANVATTVQAQVPLDDDEEPGWARALLDRTAGAMSGAVFAATPGSHCGPCQLKESCPAQSEGRFL